MDIKGQTQAELSGSSLKTRIDLQILALLMRTMHTVDVDEPVSE